MYKNGVPYFINIQMHLFSATSKPCQRPANWGFLLQVPARLWRSDKPTKWWWILAVDYKWQALHQVPEHRPWIGSRSGLKPGQRGQLFWLKTGDCGSGMFHKWYSYNNSCSLVARCRKPYDLTCEATLNTNPETKEKQPGIHKPECSF